MLLSHQRSSLPPFFPPSSRPSSVSKIKLQKALQFLPCLPEHLLVDSRGTIGEVRSVSGTTVHVWELPGEPDPHLLQVARRMRETNLVPPKEST